MISICPPEALRPHYQEAYLLGEYPTVSSYEEKMEYDFREFDFSRRLICKFRLPEKDFWDTRYFPKIYKKALFPDDHDVLKNKIIDRIQPAYKVITHMPNFLKSPISRNRGR